MEVPELSKLCLNKLSCDPNRDNRSFLCKNLIDSSTKSCQDMSHFLHDFNTRNNVAGLVYCTMKWLCCTSLQNVDKLVKNTQCCWKPWPARKYDTRICPCNLRQQQECTNICVKLETKLNIGARLVESKGNHSLREVPVRRDENIIDCNVLYESQKRRDTGENDAVYELLSKNLCREQNDPVREQRGQEFRKMKSRNVSYCLVYLCDIVLSFFKAAYSVLRFVYCCLSVCTSTILCSLRVFDLTERWRTCQLSSKGRYLSIKITTWHSIRLQKHLSSKVGLPREEGCDTKISDKDLPIILSKYVSLAVTTSTFLKRFHFSDSQFSKRNVDANSSQNTNSRMKTRTGESLKRKEKLESFFNNKFNIYPSLKLHKSNDEMFKNANNERINYVMNNPLGLLPNCELTNIKVNMLPSSQPHGIPWRLFERETMRLASFAHYPASAAKNPSLLASSGFVYIGDGVSDKVKCFFCSGVKESWRESDDIDQVHLSLNPLCPVVIVQSTNNVSSEITSREMDGSITDFSSAVLCSQNMSVSRPGNSQSSAASEGRSVQHNAPEPHNFGHDDTDSLSSHDMPPDPHRSLETRTIDRNASSQGSQLVTSNTGSNVGQATSPQAATRSLVGRPNCAANRRSVRTRPSVQTVNNPPQNGSNISQIENSRNAQSHETSSGTDQIQHGSSIDNQNLSLHQNINSQIYSIPAGTRNTSTSDMTSSTTVTSGSSTALPDQAPLTYQALGIFHERPKYIEYAVLARRIQTFEGWPEGHPMKIEDLAKSGLFFAGYGDCCRCFFCGGGLRNWEKEDDPLVEHARWFGKCSFLRQNVGADFVEAVLAIAPHKNTITLAQVKEYLQQKGQRVNIASERVITDDAAVKSLIQSGYDAVTVTRAAKRVKDRGEVLSADVILQVIREERLGAAAQELIEVEDSDNIHHDERLQTLKEQNYALRNNLICKICMDKEVRIVFLPCGHLVSCQECAAALLDCPVCRSHIRATAMANIR